MGRGPILGVVAGLAVLACVVVTADDGVDLSSLSEGQRLLLTVDSLKTLSAAIGAVAVEAKRRSGLLDKYLAENGLAEAYLKAQPQIPERAPKVAEWSDKKTSDRVVPLSFDDALAVVMEIEMEDRGDEIRQADPKDTDDLKRQEKAYREMAKKRFDETLPMMIEVDRRIDFLREKGQFEKARVWAKGEIERQDVEAKQQKREEKAAAEAEKKERQQEQEAKREVARQRRIEKVEQRWQKQAEAYQLRTDRERAKRGTTYPWGWDYRPW